MGRAILTASSLSSWPRAWDGAGAVLKKGCNSHRQADRSQLLIVAPDLETAHALANQIRALPHDLLRRVCHHQGDYLAVIAGDEVFGARQRHHALTDGPQDRITLGVSKRVVEFLEMIDVDHHDGEGMAVSA